MSNRTSLKHYGAALQNNLPYWQWPDVGQRSINRLEDLCFRKLKSSQGNVSFVKTSVHNCFRVTKIACLFQGFLQISRSRGEVKTEIANRTNYVQNESSSAFNIWTKHGMKKQPCGFIAYFFLTCLSI